MAAVTSVSFSPIGQSSWDRKALTSRSWTPSLASNFEAFRFRTGFSCHYVGVRAPNSTSRLVIHCMSTATGVNLRFNSNLFFLIGY
uniref:Uncharacterized protein MANES_13G152400 n=1 Tax=Rhizophora mucronata TaxID=61149 RepID=A0A2P2JS99_RHIMU